MAYKCEECGYVYDLTPADAAVAMRSFARRYRAPLSRGLGGEDLNDILRFKPAPDVWSALEYACHVRDVFAVQRERVHLILTKDNPVLEPMGRDERAVRDRYNEQDPAAVGDELAANAEAFAAAIEHIPAAELTRTAIYPWPETTERSLLWIIQHTVHEGSHHLLDIGRVLRAARGR